MGLSAISRAVDVTDRVAREHARMARRRRLLLIVGWLGIGGIALGLWQLLSGRLLDPFFFSSPSDVWSSLVALARNGELVTNATPTVVEAALGYVLGVVVGLVAAGTLGLSRRAYAIFEPFILALYSIPAIAFAPVLIVAFGVGPLPKILLAAYFVFLVVFVNGVAGVRAAPLEWIHMARVMGANAGQTIRKIILPSAGPYLVAAFKAALPGAAIGAVVGEFIASEHGIGYLISSAAARDRTGGVFAAVTILSVGIGLVSLLLNRATLKRFGEIA
jgi:NitT/TauT family transport system permease protein